MRGELVAIDLETTGLDPQQDDIIEIGAVRMREGEIIDSYETMVNPGKPIPAQTTHITGIRQEDVTSAPRIQRVLPQLAAFAGDAPIIAHNITLDMGFLQGRHGILKQNAVIDTYDLASVLLPAAPRYNLTSLTQEAGIKLEHAHRALDDAHATALLYWALWQRILELPHALLAEINNAAAGLKWSSSVVFDAALRESTTSTRDQQRKPDSVFAPLDGALTPLKPADETTPLDSSQIAMMLGPGGSVAARMPTYEDRPQQAVMAQAVADAFNDSEHILVEADTGTGKSLAYLLPAVLWATQNRHRVLISTHTINLQDQLFEKDVPALQAALDVPFTTAVMKGRANYLCPRRLASVRRRKPTSIDELLTLAKILVWLETSETGDRSEINLRGPNEFASFQRLSAQDENCTLHQCETTMQGTCPFYKARKRAEAAHLLVVNHALLMADAASKHQVLPEYHYAIIDEAHHLEDAVTRSLTFHLDQTELLRRAADLGDPQRGLLVTIITTLREAGITQGLNKLEQVAGYISEAARAMQVHVRKLFRSLGAFVLDVQERSDFNVTIRLDERLRARSSFAHVQASWATLHEFFEVLGQALKGFSRALTKLDRTRIAHYTDFVSSTQSTADYFETARQQLHQFIAEPDANTVYWASLSKGRSEPVIHSAPLHIGPMQERYFWNEKRSIVLTSATLRTHSGFDHIAGRLYADGLRTLQLDTTFDYKASTLVYLPNDIPEPGDRQNYQRAVERGIIELSAALGGRVLVLFTSYTHLRQTSQAVSPRLALGNITVYDQSDGSSRQSLLDGFIGTEKAVLMGTRSFWEGIDIPGTDLSAVVMVRLPFAVPSDPIYAARSETYTNGFEDYGVPDAVLRFRQGFGRLIRSHKDRGVVTVFDSRINTKGYGMHFLDALPDVNLTSGPLASLPETALNWLGEDARDETYKS